MPLPDRPMNLAEIYEEFKPSSSGIARDLLTSVLLDTSAEVHWRLRPGPLYVVRHLLARAHDVLMREGLVWVEEIAVTKSISTRRYHVYRRLHHPEEVSDEPA